MHQRRGHGIIPIAVKRRQSVFSHTTAARSMVKVPGNFVALTRCTRVLHFRFSNGTSQGYRTCVCQDYRLSANINTNVQY